MNDIAKDVLAMAFVLDLKESIERARRHGMFDASKISDSELMERICQLLKEESANTSERV